MKKPLLIIVNGLPASGKTTLSKRLGAELGLPVFSRDGIFATLFEAMPGWENSLLGLASFKLLYQIAGIELAAGRSLIVEGFFGRPELRTGEFQQIRLAYDFEPFQILCQADGKLLVERYLIRLEANGPDKGQQDRAGFEQNRERMLKGDLEPLALGGQLVRFDTTNPTPADYANLLANIRRFL